MGFRLQYRREYLGFSRDRHDPSSDHRLRQVLEHPSYQGMAFIPHLVASAISLSTFIFQASGRELSCVLLTGMLLCFGTTYVILAKPSKLICGLRRIGVGLGFAVLYSATLVKTNRIYRIFTSAQMAKRCRFISPASQLVIAGILISVQVLASLIWLAVEPPSVKLVYPTRSQVVSRCAQEDHWFLVSLSYDCALIILCTVFAVKTRMVPENFNEAKFIGFTMYTTCIIWLAFVPLYFGTEGDFKVRIRSGDPN